MVERYEPDGELDRRLRAALEPTPAQVSRVVAGALGAGEDRRRRPLAVAAGVAAAAVALLVLALVLLPGLRTGPPPGAATASRYSLSNRDGLLVVRSLDGGATFFRSGERPSEPPRGMMLIVRGDRKSVV